MVAKQAAFAASHAAASAFLMRARYVSADGLLNYIARAQVPFLAPRDATRAQRAAPPWT